MSSAYNQAFLAAQGGGGNTPSSPPATNPQAFAGAPTQASAPHAYPQQNRQPAFAPSSNQAFQGATSTAPQQQAGQQKPKMAHVKCGTCGAINGVPPGAPSFNCYKCGKTSQKPGLAQQKPPEQWIAKTPPQTPQPQQQRPPQQQPKYDPNTGRPINQAPAQQPKFDPQTGRPLGQQQAPPQARFDPQTGEPLMKFDPQTGKPLVSAQQQQQATQAQKSYASAIPQQQMVQQPVQVVQQPQPTTVVVQAAQPQVVSAPYVGQQIAYGAYGGGYGAGQGFAAGMMTGALLGGGYGYGYGCMGGFDGNPFTPW